MGCQEACARTGVLLINTGSPAAPTETAVRSYLEQFLMDDRIRPLPAPVWKVILQHMILPRRSAASAKKYAAIWTSAGSPLIAGCRALATRVEQELHEGGGGDDFAAKILVRAAMMYGEPGIDGALEEFRAAGCDRIVALPLYPQSAYSTTAAALDALGRALAQMTWSPQVIPVESYGDDAAYLDAVAATIRAAGFDAARDHLLLSFHAVPLPDVDAGDTYPAQARATVRALADRLGVAEDAWTLAYQSPFEDGRRWTGPNTARTMRDLARSDARRLMVVCPGFAVDCLETLYDIEQVMRADYQDACGGDTHGLVYVPCLNDSAAHAAALAGVIRRVLST